MGPRERLAVVLIVIASFVLLVAARACRLLWRRLRGRPFEVSRLDLILAVGLLLAASAILYGRYVEPLWIAVEHVELEFPQIPVGSNAVTLVQISDLHSTGEPRLAARIPEMVRRLEPDLIVFTGDATNEPAGVPVFRELMRSLAAIAPTYTVRGNRDLDAAAGVDFVADTGAIELEGEAVDLSLGSIEIRLVGSGTSEGWSRVRSLLRGAPAESLAVYLSHSPDAVVDVEPWGADLVLAGHTHGGQVALPFYGALFTASRFDKRFEAGLYRVGATWLYVNRGLGFQASLPRFRFCARPEVTKFRLVSESG